MKSFLFFIFFFSELIVCAQYSFKINGSAPAFLNNKYLSLTITDNYSKSRFEKTDSVLVKNGLFTFTGIINKPCEFATLFRKGSNGFFNMAVDSGISYMIISPVSKNSHTYKNPLSNAKVLYSPSNDLVQQIDSLNIHYYQTYGKPSKMNKYVLELDKETLTVLREKELNLIGEKNTVFCSLIQLYRSFSKKRLTAIEKVFESFSPDLKQSKLGKEFKEKIEKAKSLFTGKKVPDFSIEINGDSLFTNNQVKGNVYLIAFGATWCKPCKDNYPILNQLFLRYKAKGFKIVAINLDGDEATWEKQLKENHYGWIQLCDRTKWNDSKLVSIFDISFIPYYLIVNKEGIIVFNSYQEYGLNYSKLSEQISECLTQY